MVLDRPREPLTEREQAHLPPLLLLLVPFIKAGFPTQPKAIKERATHEGNGVLKLCDQSIVFCL